MDNSTIATLTLSALSPLVVKGIEKLVEKTAEEGFNERKAIWQRVKELFKTDDLTLLNLLSDAESNPEKRGELKGELKAKLEFNPQLTKELEVLLTKLQTSSTTITSEEITDSALENEIKRSSDNYGKAEISNKKIEKSKIKSKIELS